jgi:hypothetical protein
MPADLSKLRNFFGTTDPNKDLPPGINAYAADAGGLIILANNLMKLMIYSSLVIAFINLLVSGVQFIGSSGNPEIIKTASGRIWISLLGLVVAAGSLVLAGILGLIFFGSATAIISPKIYGP